VGGSWLGSGLGKGLAGGGDELAVGRVTKDGGELGKELAGARELVMGTGGP